MKIELHIDRLVVDAGSGAAVDRERLAQAVSQALAQGIVAGTSRQPGGRQGPAPPRADGRRPTRTRRRGAVRTRRRVA